MFIYYCLLYRFITVEAITCFNDNVFFCRKSDTKWDISIIVNFIAF